MKRFWTEVTIEPRAEGFAVLLDGRAVNTPMRNMLLLPGRELAEAVAQEWRDCGEDIDPLAMPMTGFANAGVEHVGTGRQAFVDAVAAFGESDLFCYRAEGPERLAARQEDLWGNWLRWAQARYLVNFTVVSGVVHADQPGATLARLKEAVAALNDFQLAAASKLTHLSGSLVAVLAMAEGAAQAEAIWPDLILDELWQEEQWGADDFALKNRRDREAEFLDAARFMELAGSV